MFVAHVHAEVAEAVVVPEEEAAVGRHCQSYGMEPCFFLFAFSTCLDF